MELKQRQLDFRKAEEREKTQRVRNIVNENRVRVSLQSELVGNYTRIDPGYRAQIQDILNDKFGSVDEKMEFLREQAALVENVESELMKAMDHDCLSALDRVREAERRAGQRDEHKEVTKIYDEYLAEKHPVYPTSLKKIAAEEAQPLTEREKEL